MRLFAPLLKISVPIHLLFKHIIVFLTEGRRHFILKRSRQKQLRMSVNRQTDLAPHTKNATAWAQKYVKLRRLLLALMIYGTPMSYGASAWPIAIFFQLQSWWRVWWNVTEFVREILKNLSRKFWFGVKHSLTSKRNLKNWRVFRWI